jgi:hypothetical protein
VVGVAVALGIAAAVAVFAVRSDDDDVSAPERPGVETPPSRVAPVKASVAQEEPAERDVQPTAVVPDSPTSPRDTPVPADEPQAKPPKSPRPHRTRGSSKPSRTKPTGKRGRALDDMYPSG